MPLLKGQVVSFTALLLFLASFLGDAFSSEQSDAAASFRTFGTPIVEKSAADWHPRRGSFQEFHVSAYSIEAEEQDGTALNKGARSVSRLCFACYQAPLFTPAHTGRPCAHYHAQAPPINA